MHDYSRIAGTYRGLVEPRRFYLEAVDRRFRDISRITGARWLDVGTGDGSRALALNSVIAKSLTVVEPSSLLPESFEEDHPDTVVIRRSLNDAAISESFGLISALWNVVGHVESLPGFLAKCSELLDDDGVFFFDLNSPFNLKRFGLRAVARNFFSKSDEYSFQWNPSLPDSRVKFYRVSYVLDQLSLLGFRSTVSFVDYESGRSVGSSFLGSAVVVAIKQRASDCKPEGI